MHTPGRWDAGHYKGDPAVFSARGNGTLCLATIWSDFIEREESEANAKLIAAAPDLLKALKQARNQVVAFALDTLSPDRAEAQVEYIDTAIKKATE